MVNPSHPRYAGVPNAEAILAQPYKESLLDKTLEKTFMAVAKKDFDSNVEASMKCARRCGNMYTASLYGGLSSLVSSIEPSEFLGKRVSMFAYGSGIASSFFTIKVKGDTTRIRENLDLVNRLASMKVVPCQEYVDALKVSIRCSRQRCSGTYVYVQLRESHHLKKDFTPSGSIDNIWPGGYYLETVDSKFRRKYGRAPRA